MDIVLEKTTYAPGEKVGGRFVVPRDTHQQEDNHNRNDSRLCFPHVRVRLVGEEHAQVDLNPKYAGLSSNNQSLTGTRHVIQDTQVIFENEVTVPRAIDDPSQPSANEWTYPFEITLPEGLPGTRTFRKPHATGHSFDSCQIRYVLHVSLPPYVPNTTTTTTSTMMSLSSASELLESSLQVATDMMREACVHPSSLGVPYEEEKSTKDTNPIVNATIPNHLVQPGNDCSNKTDPTLQLQVEEAQPPPWHTLNQTWNVKVQAKPYTNPTTVIELQVGPRKEVPQEVCLCGLLEYTRVTYPLVPVNGPLFEVSGGQSVTYTLTDPHGNLGPGGMVPDVFVVQAKLSQTIHWAAEGHSIIFPVRKEWKMPPSPRFTAKGDFKTATDSTTELVTGKMDIPVDLADTYAGKLVDVENQVIFSLLMEKENALVGTTPGLAISTRGRQ